MAKKPYLEAGKIVGTHGVRGEVRVQPWCDTPAQFAALKVVYYDERGERPVRLSSRVHGNICLSRLEGVDTMQDAAALRDRVLFLDRNDLPLEPGRHFIQDLLGLTIVDADTGETYGTLSEVSFTGANDVYHMRTGNREILIPAIPQVVVETDIDGGVLRIRPIKGLLDDED